MAVQPLLIHDHESHLSPRLLSEMHRLRHDVFRDRMGWEVPSVNGLERDEFDALDPVYAIARHGEHTIGCWRLLPTTGPNMLRDVFPELMHGQTVPEGEHIWEASRFAIHLSDRNLISLAGIHQVTSQLIAGLLEKGMELGLDKIVAVTDTRFERILNRAGLETNRYGPPLQVGVCQAVAGWFDVNQENLARVRRIGGLTLPALPQRFERKAA